MLHIHTRKPQLDAGVQEQILLLSRDEQSMLVASYGDVKVRLEAGSLLSCAPAMQRLLLAGGAGESSSLTTRSLHPPHPHPPTPT